MYESHFGLTADPFSLSPDPDFLYLSPAHAEALAGLRIALESRRGLTTLIGEVGTGKTTLLYALLRDAEPKVHAAYLANTKLGFLDLLRQALADLGVPCDRGGRLVLLDALHDFLRRCDAEGSIAALVVDEAQNLDADTFEHLRLLTNFETYSAKLLQIVLVGQPELAATLRRPELRQVNERIAHRCALAPLSVGEAQRYLDHRLQRAGAAPTLLAPAARAILIAAARGVPRRLNVLGHTALLFAYGRERDAGHRARRPGGRQRRPARRRHPRAAAPQLARRGLGLGRRRAGGGRRRRRAGRLHRCAAARRIAAGGGRGGDARGGAGRCHGRGAGRFAGERAAAGGRRAGSERKRARRGARAGRGAAPGDAGGGGEGADTVVDRAALLRQRRTRGATAASRRQSGAA